jgi:hypothetical protein
MTLPSLYLPEKSLSYQFLLDLLHAGRSDSSEYLMQTLTGAAADPDRWNRAQQDFKIACYAV